LPGFALRVTAGGTKAFILDYRTKGTGRQRRVTIGRFPSWSATAARQKAKALRREVDEGGDPRGDVEAERAAPTVNDLVDRLYAEHLPKRREGTARDYRGLAEKYVRPNLGDMKVADVAFADIDRLHRKISKRAPYSGNRAVDLLSKMFSLAIRWQMRADNPAKGIERNPEERRRRYLSDDGDELVRLIAAMAKHSDQQAANIIRLLLLTGGRRGEAFTMKWADVDFAKGIWSKPASSTKDKKPHEVPLSVPARQLLADIDAAQKTKSIYVFPSSIGKTGHVVDIKKSWASICKAAGIAGLRVHDLRHSFASELVSAGASLPLIGALLGHSNPATTARYTHFISLRPAATMPFLPNLRLWSLTSKLRPTRLTIEWKF
jgi:integrase